MMEESRIPDFYGGQKVLVTGVTGFLGKAVVEKLLRSCPNVETIYVLLRPKGQAGVKERIKSVLANSIFDTIRAREPSLLNKILPIPGDISQPSLGLSGGDRLTLQENVNVIFHCAATVKFDEELSRALRTNVLGARRLLQLSKEMRSLRSFVHVSTAYANCELSEIEEKVYPLSIPEEYSNLLQRLEVDGEDELLDVDLRALLGSKPNTYTFSKAWAERVLEEEAGDLPLSIVRPSIVSAALREPQPGWVDNLLGASAVVAAISTGILHSALIHGDKRIDLIPVDILVNLLLVVGWRGRRGEIPVYNCCTGSSSPLTYEKMRRLLVKNMTQFPLMTQTPWIILWRSEWAHMCLDLLLHRLPMTVLDILATMRGQKPKLMKVYERMKGTMAVLKIFTTNEWEFETGRVEGLRGEMGSGGDRNAFNFETRNLDWDNYLLQYHLGLGKFVFGKSPENSKSSS